MDEDTYAARNEGPVQGQIVGGGNTINQNFYAPIPETKTPLTPITIWNIPFSRNTVFTGRENLLHQLHANLTASKAAVLTQPQAISGLGGIGKTQTAVEYAYRHRDSYQAVFWAQADSREALISDLAAIG